MGPPRPKEAPLCDSGDKEAPLWSSGWGPPFISPELDEYPTEIPQFMFRKEQKEQIQTLKTDN